jgi:DNA polymerase I-like protein with 3'-5' exonuclease and polymerase domains
MKKALVIFNDKITRNKWDVKFVVNCHDEFQLETKKELAEIVGISAVESIREAGEFYNLRCPLDGEYKSGLNWSQTH